MTLQRPCYGFLGTNKLSTEPNTFVKINQCLFGYSDGHRLLSTSMRLPDDTASLLLLHSDLVPGLNTSRPDGYWTGIPLPGAKVYALMRTWPAPEMPRPGCVWTHVVLIALADMARFPDLAVLSALFVRPSASAGFTTYASPLAIDPTGPAMSPISLSHRSALRVLRALYAPRASGILVDDGEPIDTAIFAAWSQQWPRLRRAFSFRTAGPSIDPSSSVRFDLRVVREPLSSPALTQVEVSSLPAEWERAAIDDLIVSEPSGFRRFLWRYGSDLKRGRNRYRFLAQLFLTTRLPALNGATLTQTLDTIVDVLPDENDGKLLKEDFLSCGRNLYSLLPVTDPIDILGYLADHIGLKALPPPPEAAFEAVHDLWSTRSSEILRITEKAANSRSTIFEQLLGHLSAVAEPANFIGLSREYPVIQKRLIRANPVLLDSPDLATVSTPELLDFLGFLPDDQDLAARVFDRLLFSANADVAAIFADRFLEMTEARVFDALVLELANSSPPVPRVWPDAVRQSSPGLVGHILDRAATTTGLGALAGWLHFDVAAGLKISSSVWGATLLRIEDDLEGQPRQRLLAYLLALALARPSPGCEPLFERAFESVHADIWSSRLPQDAFDALARFLPDLYWWQQWDTCRRLRLAVVEAYVNASLDPQSFRRLTQDSGFLEKLADIASDTKSGRRFLRRVFD